MANLGSVSRCRGNAMTVATTKQKACVDANDATNATEQQTSAPGASYAFWQDSKTNAFTDRHRDDLVGKRVLCLPRTFKVAAPSPVQLSSSLWTPAALASMKELTESRCGVGAVTSTTTGTEVSRSLPSWCPVHHHHQATQQNLMESAEIQHTQQTNENNNAVAGGSGPPEDQGLKRNRAARQAAGVSRKNSPSSLSRQSYSVMRSAHLQTTKSSVAAQAIASSKSDQRKNDDSSCDQIDSSSIPACELCDNEISKQSRWDVHESHKQYLNSLPWRLGTIRAVSHRDLNDAALNIMIEFDLLEWETREWYQVRDGPCDEDDSYRDTRSSYNHEDACESNLKQSPNKKTKRIDCDDVDSMPKQGRGSNREFSHSSLSTEHEKKENEAPSILEGSDDENSATEDMNDDDSKRTELSPGAFSALLIESSICCLRRRHAPTGKDKLWPALVFEPLIDELGLFDSTTTSLKAVEYFDPDTSYRDNLQPTCDIEAIASELKSEFANLIKAASQKKVQDVSSITGVDQNQNNPVMNSGEQTVENAQFVDDNSRKKILSGDNTECGCWSPRVEFVQDSAVHKLCRPGADRGSSSFETFENATKKGETIQTSPLKQENNLSTKPYQEQSSSSQNEINCGSLALTSGNLNSFKRFLRFFHHVHITNLESRRAEQMPSSSNCTDSKDRERSYIRAAETNDLLEAIVQFPKLYHILREWHLYQDAQSLLGNIYTAALLVGNRVKVYRSSGTTQWYTAVIISYDERTNLLTLIDDTVLEEHHEDPALLEMHLIDDRLIQSIIEGDDNTGGSSTRRRAQRTNQRQAAQTAQMAIMNSSTTVGNAAGQSSGSGSSGNGCGSGGSTLGNKQQNKGLSLIHSSLSPALSPSAASSSSSSAFSIHQQLPAELGVSQSRTSANSDSGSGKHTSSSRQHNNKDTVKSKGKRAPQTGSFLTNEAECSSNNCLEPWANSKSRRESDSSKHELFRRQITKPTDHKFFDTGKSGDKFPLIELEALKSQSLSNETNFLLPFNTQSSSVPLRLGRSRGVTIDGKNFLAHRLRLEALDQGASVNGTLGGAVAQGIADSSSLPENSSHCPESSSRRKFTAQECQLNSNQQALIGKDPETDKLVAAAESTGLSRWRPTLEKGEEEEAAERGREQQQQQEEQATGRGRDGCPARRPTPTPDGHYHDNHKEQARASEGSEKRRRRLPSLPEPEPEPELLEPEIESDSDRPAGQRRRRSRQQSSEPARESKQACGRSRAEEGSSGSSSIGGGGNASTGNVDDCDGQQHPAACHYHGGEQEGRRPLFPAAAAAAALEAVTAAAACPIASLATAAAPVGATTTTTTTTAATTTTTTTLPHFTGNGSSSGGSSSSAKAKGELERGATVSKQRSSVVGEKQQRRANNERQQQQQQQQAPRAASSSSSDSNNLAKAEAQQQQQSPPPQTCRLVVHEKQTRKQQQHHHHHSRNNNHPTTTTTWPPPSEVHQGQEEEEKEESPQAHQARHTQDSTIITGVHQNGATAPATLHQPPVLSLSLSLQQSALPIGGPASSPLAPPYSRDTIAAVADTTSTKSAPSTPPLALVPQQRQPAPDAFPAGDKFPVPWATLSSQQQQQQQQQPELTIRQQQASKQSPTTGATTTTTTTTTTITTTALNNDTSRRRDIISNQSGDQQTLTLLNHHDQQQSASIACDSNTIPAITSSSTIISTTTTTIAGLTTPAPTTVVILPSAEGAAPPPPQPTTTTTTTQARSVAMHNFGPNPQEQRKTDTLPWPNNLANLQQQQQQQQLQFQQQAAAAAIVAVATSNSSTTSGNSAAQQHSLSQQQQQYGSHSSQASATTSQQQQQHQQSLASKVDQIIRTTLYDSLHLPKSAHSSMPSSSSSSTSTPSSSSMIFNPAANLTISSTQNFNNNNTTNTGAVSGLMSVAAAAAAAHSPQLTSFYGSTMSTADTLNNNIIINTSSSGNNNNNTSNNNSTSNLSAKASSAHSASHSALAAAAALQSLNQPHLHQRSQHHHHQQQQLLQLQQQQQQQQSNNSRPPSNSSLTSNLHASNNAMPKLGVTSTTSSDHQNHNHLALSSLQIDQNPPDQFAARFQQQQQKMPPGIRQPINWQDQVNQGVGGGPQRWLGGGYGSPYASGGNAGGGGGAMVTSYASPTFSASSPNNLATSSAVNNLSNSNSMIGQDGDNQAHTNNSASSRQQHHNNNARELSSTPQAANQFGPPQTTSMDAAKALVIPNSMRQNYPWLENMKPPLLDTSSSKTPQQSHQRSISEEMDKNSERLGLFMFNLLSPNIPGTNKPKKVIPLDSVDELRQSIYCGEFYTKFEDTALGILTNQVIVPDFSIIDYIRRDKFSLQELEKIESVHKRLGVSNFLCLIELAQQRSYLSMNMRGNDIKTSHHDTTTSSNLNAGTGIYQQQQQQQQMFNHHLQGLNKGPPFLAPFTGKSDANSSSGPEKGIRRSSQSPSDILSRSQASNNNNAPRGSYNPYSSASSTPQNFPGSSPNLAHLPPPPVGISQRNQHPSQSRSSPFQPAPGQSSYMGARPPRSNSTIGLALEPPASMNNSNNSLPRQPPAAHQSSTARPNIMGSSPNLASSSASGGPPVSAHMSSKTPQTPRLQTIDTLPNSSSARHAPGETHSPGSRQMAEDRPNKGAFAGPAPTSSSFNHQQASGYPSKSDIDSIAGMPVHALLSLKQQDLVNREIALKRTGTPHFGTNNNHGFSGPPHHQGGAEVSRSPGGGMEPHLNSRSPMNSQMQQPFYGSHLSNLNNGAMFKQPNFSAASAMSMPPPSTSDYHNKGLNQNDLNRLTEPTRSSNISPNINALSGTSEAQLKQYSALVNAYNQQQHQIMMANKSNLNLGPNSALPLGLNPNNGGFNSSVQGSLHSPQTTSDAILLDLHNQQQQQNPGYHLDGRPPSHPLSQQQTSPKQNNQQRSIITGSASSGPKRNKKVKHSPPGFQSADSKSASISPNDTNSPMLNKSVPGALVSNAGLCLQTAASSGNKTDNNVSQSSLSGNNETSQPQIGDPSGLLLSSLPSGNNHLLRGQPELSQLATASPQPAILSADVAAVAATASVAQQQVDSGASASSSSPLLSMQASAHSANPTPNNSCVSESGAVYVNSGTHQASGQPFITNADQNLGKQQSPGADKSCKIESNSLQANSQQQDNSNIYNTICTNNLSSSNKADTETVKQQQQQAPLTSNSSNCASSANAEPSKYQKLYTKKAWLKNYDQEEDQARLKNNSEDAMAVRKIESIKSETNAETTTNKLTPSNANDLSSSSSSSSSSNDAKNTKVDAKKKVKDNNSSLKKPATANPPAPAVRACRAKIVENDSEASNVSTSELDSDEAASYKTTVRRMPKRKVKPSSDRDEQRSPKTKLTKEAARKKGKKQQVVEEASNKRKRTGESDANLKKSKKSKSHSSLKRKQDSLKSTPNYDDENDDSNLSAPATVDSAPKVKSSKKLKKKSASIKTTTVINSPCLSPTNDENSSQPLEASEEVDERAEADKLHRRTGEKFLQADPCYDIVPKSIRCLECRRVRQPSFKSDKVLSSKQSAKTNWDDFCRFYEFRKLRYNKASQIIVAGFSDSDDAKDSDKTIWLPDTNEIPKNLSFEVAKFILTNVGDEFCNLVLQERAAKDLYKSQTNGSDKTITWKRAVNGLRELCDVCSTTLFNCHYVCERCGFVVCLDCYQSRSNAASIDELSSSSTCVSSIKKESDGGSDKSSAAATLKNANDPTENGQSETPEQPVAPAAKKSKRDSFGWIYCAKNEEHSHDKLTLTQIIAGDCLEEVWDLLHKVRSSLGLGRCFCETKKSDELRQTKVGFVKKENGGIDGKMQDLSKSPKSDSMDGKEDSTDVTEGSHSTLKGLLLAYNSNNCSATNAEDKSSTTLAEPTKTQKPSLADHTTEDKKESCEDISRSSACSSPLNDKMFNDFSNEDDSQEDMKLSQQVTAAIEGCISSLPNGSTATPDLVLETKGSESSEEIKISSDELNDGADTHSWLCHGDLLVLSHANHSKNIELFRRQWRQGKPVLVRGVDKLMQIDMWLPQFFGKEFGDYRSDLVDCRNGDIHRHSMKKYWEGFEPTNVSGKKKIKDEKDAPLQIAPANNEELSNGPSYYSGSALWRLKDWPPGQDFYEILPSHYEDFMNNLPLSSYTTRSGQLNLACRLPKEMLKPDLGPKMYSAYGTSKFPERGTTNLHLDISDAINVMVYVSGATSFNNGSEEARETFEKTIDESVVDAAMKEQIRSKKFVPGALWHIFKPSDAQKMREFLNKIADERNISPEKRNDPIHDQTWYLNEPLLDRLYQEHGVKAYAILQCMGDAILIPAGAPHQVKNVQNCIKVANDFVSPENVRYCLQLTNEFRSLPETHINQEDKLQIKNILYHSVKESLQYILNQNLSVGQKDEC